MLDKEQILWFCKEKESPKHKQERPEGRPKTQGTDHPKENVCPIAATTSMLP